MKSTIYTIVGSILLLTTACTSTPYYHEMSNYELHTPYAVKYKASQNYDAEIRQLMLDYYHAINPFDSTSIISHINRNEETEIDSIFTHVFNTAQQISRTTNGAFDATCAPYINLWGFGFTQTDTAITTSTIDSLSSFIGYNKIAIKEGKVIKQDPRTILNFSALGDGCACDLIGNLLENYGVDNYMVEVGGEVRTKGVNPQGEAWRIGIVTPQDDIAGENRNLQAIVAIEGNYGLATSGNYRNFYEKEGRKYGHTIDPQTGYPAQQDVLSATVIAPTAIEADGYATAIMVMGRTKTQEWAAQHPHIAYYIIYAAPNDSTMVEYSSSFAPFLVK